MSPDRTRLVPIAALLIGALAGCGREPSGLPPIVSDTTTHLPPSTNLAVSFAVSVDRDRAPISPFIYGSNDDGGSDLWTVRRRGGNRTTGYNWETNFSNAGIEYFNQSDLYSLVGEGLPASDAAIPGRAITFAHDQSLAMGAQTLVTLPMAGYVAADGRGPVSASELAPSSRWIKLLPKKPTAFSLTPDLGDSVVYTDELVNLLVQRYGPAGTPRGVRFYGLDNEPSLWDYTHPFLHPVKTGVVELLDRSIALASAVKAVDANAEVMGPTEYGMEAFVDFQNAPEWPAMKGGYDWFLDYYLDRMHKAEQSNGKRVLDLLDVHWYPEAKGDNRITESYANSENDALARLQAPRSLWDSSYHETSWVQQKFPTFLPLLPRLKRSIAQYYPGTRLAISEYTYGGFASPSGGIAQADVLGLFGRYGVYLATTQGASPSDVYLMAGFKLYRDYDGRRSTFGSTTVGAQTSDVPRTSIYASIDGSDPSVLHVILLNKGMHDTIDAKVQLTGGAAYTSGQAWGFDANSAKITSRPAVTGITGNAFTYAVPPLTAVHLILR